MQRTEPKTNPSFRSLAFNLSMAFEAVQVSSFRSLSKSLFGRSDLAVKILASPRNYSRLPARFAAPISATRSLDTEYQDLRFDRASADLFYVSNLCQPF